MSTFDYSKMKINEDLYLGPFQASDKEALLVFMNNPVHYANTLRVPNPYEESDADAWLALTKQEIVEHGHPINWAIRSKEHGLIGGIGSFLLTGKEGHRDEIGYWMGFSFRGNGYMTETVAFFCQYLFRERPALVRIEAKTFPHNPASLRVLEKVGFEREGYAKKLHLKNGLYLDSIMMVLFRE